MNLRTTARDEFPRGWWHSGRWWLQCLKDLLLNGLVAVAALLFIREAVRLVRHRDCPRELSRSKVSAQAWMAGLVVGAAVVAGMVALAVQDSASVQGITLILVSASVTWSLAWMATSAIALLVLLRSRIRHRRQWQQLDFMQAHTPKHGRPPETIEEYQALRMKPEA